MHASTTPSRRSLPPVNYLLAAATPGILAPSGFDRLHAMQGMFALYGLLGVAGRLLYSRNPQRSSAPDARAATALGPSRKIVFKLAALFRLDAFAASAFAWPLLICGTLKIVYDLLLAQFRPVKPSEDIRSARTRRMQWNVSKLRGARSKMRFAIAHSRITGVCAERSRKT